MKIVLLAAIIGISAPALAASNQDSDGQAQTHHEAGTPVDPTYGKIAAATGGRVYDMRNPQDVRAFQKELARPKEEMRRRELKELLDISHLYEKLPGSDSERFIVYALLKWAAYAGWCFVGLGLAGKMTWRPVAAAGWGLVRVGLGIAFGFTVFITFVYIFRWAPPPEWLSYVVVYLGVYIPVRWVEWSIMSRAIGVPRKSWRVGGIAVSCLADFVQIIFFGSLIPIGRFLC